ncbi:hypothetical protein LTR53_014655, partial [Teratosphaeriaceae sp. CCFEE 6253]
MAMNAVAKGARLEEWFRSNGGYLNPSVNVAYSDTAGYHVRSHPSSVSPWQANAHIPSGARITTVPHSLALCHLNALVDGAFPVFRERRHDFAVENLAFFYLMSQYLHRARSFWQPYLDTLPAPDAAHTTPLWFDAAEDRAWLEGTDVLHTMLGRREVYERYYQIGLRILQSAGMDVAPYT